MCDNWPLARGGYGQRMCRELPARTRAVEASDPHRFDDGLDSTRGGSNIMRVACLGPVVPNWQVTRFHYTLAHVIRFQAEDRECGVQGSGASAAKASAEDQ